MRRRLESARMPPKKKPQKLAKRSVANKRPARKIKAVRAPTKKAAKAPRASKPSKPSRSGKTPAPRVPAARAERLARFSQQVVKEEQAPVAVRTFNEARAGIEQSKVLDIRTGAVRPVKPPKDPKPAPVSEPEQDESAPPSRLERKPPRPSQPESDPDVEDEVARDLEQMDRELRPTAQPRVEPLMGQPAVPKRSNPLEQEFQVAERKKGKKAAVPTKEDLGKIELRMQRGTKDEAIAHANPDYLQRSFRQAAQKGKVAATGTSPADEPAKSDEFEVAMDKRRPRVDAALTDFGDIEIAQQTRRGSKKVGKLETDTDEEPK